MPENSNNDIPHPLVAAVADTIARKNMLRHGDGVLVGVSGGADSVALAHVLYRLSAGLNLRLGVAHLNHALRGKDADRDAAFVQTFARQMSLPCFNRRHDVARQRQRRGGSLEETGRQARYRFYTQTAQKEGFDKIALGHHADDNAELVLMNMLRGAGPMGIAGIPPSREPGVIRPLIHVKRFQIKAYIKDNHLDYVEDASNQDTRFLRNRVRHELLPLLTEAYNPRVADALVRMASITRVEEEWLEQLTGNMLKAAILTADEQQLTLSRTYLSGLHLAPARRVVRGALKTLKHDLHGITLTHIDDIMGLVHNGPDPGEIHLPGQLRIRLKDMQVILTKEAHPLRSAPSDRDAEQEVSFNYQIPLPATQPTSIVIAPTGQKLVFSCLPGKNLPASAIGGQNVAFFDMDKLNFPLVLRNHETGDRFTPLGMQGSQKVKKFFINAKIARNQRKGCPVILSRDRIIWVVGLRMDDGFKITPSTRNVLKVELLLA
jgi:tRNA(Ile)-lysidine synthase